MVATAHALWLVIGVKSARGLECQEQVYQCAASQQLRNLVWRDIYVMTMRMSLQWSRVPKAGKRDGRLGRCHGEGTISGHGCYSGEQR